MYRNHDDEWKLRQTALVSHAWNKLMNHTQRPIWANIVQIHDLRIIDRNLCFVLFVHVHKMYQSTLLAQMARGRKNSEYNLNFENKRALHSAHVCPECYKYIRCKLQASCILVCIIKNLTIVRASKHSTQQRNTTNTLTMRQSVPNCR